MPTPLTARRPMAAARPRAGAAWPGAVWLCLWLMLAGVLPLAQAALTAHLVQHAAALTRAGAGSAAVPAVAAGPSADRAGPGAVHTGEAAQPACDLCLLGGALFGSAGPTPQAAWASGPRPASPPPSADAAPRATGPAAAYLSRGPPGRATPQRA